MPWVISVVSLSMEVSLTVISLAWGAAGARLPLFFFRAGQHPRQLARGIRDFRRPVPVIGSCQCHLPRLTCCAKPRLTATKQWSHWTSTPLVGVPGLPGARWGHSRPALPGSFSGPRLPDWIERRRPCLPARPSNASSRLQGVWAPSRLTPASPTGAVATSQAVQRDMEVEPPPVTNLEPYRWLPPACCGQRTCAAVAHTSPARHLTTLWRMRIVGQEGLVRNWNRTAPGQHGSPGGPVPACGPQAVKGTAMLFLPCKPRASSWQPDNGIIHNHCQARQAIHHGMTYAWVQAPPRPLLGSLCRRSQH